MNKKLRNQERKIILAKTVCTYSAASFLANDQISMRIYVLVYAKSPEMDIFLFFCYVRVGTYLYCFSIASLEGITYETVLAVYKAFVKEPLDGDSWRGRYVRTYVRTRITSRWTSLK